MKGKSSYYRIIFILLVLSLTCFSGVEVFSESLEWLSIENEFFIVKYQPGYDNDANNILNYCNFARNVVIQKYPHELTQKVYVFIYDSLHWGTSPGQTIAITGGTYGLEIRFLAPSDTHYDDDWYQKNIIHEYTHMPYYNVREGPDFPGWFGQGLAEYFGIYCSTQSILMKYEPDFRKTIGGLVRKGDGYFSIVCGLEYEGGCYIVKYMYENYGEDKVRNVITSKASFFTQALDEGLDVTYNEFENNWLNWSCREFGVDPNLYVSFESYEGKQLYNDLLSNYEIVNNSYNQMNITYNELLSNYDLLSFNYNKLQSDFRIVNNSLTTLNTNFSTLYVDFNEMQRNYSSLRSSYESILSDLGLYKNLIYLFASMIVIFIATTIFFALKRGKQAPRSLEHEKIAKETRYSKISKKEYGYVVGIIFLLILSIGLGIRNRDYESQMMRLQSENAQILMELAELQNNNTHMLLELVGLQNENTQILTELEELKNNNSRLLRLLNESNEIIIAPPKVVGQIHYTTIMDLITTRITSNGGMAGGTYDITNKAEIERFLVTVKYPEGMDSTAKPWWLLGKFMEWAGPTLCVGYYRANGGKFQLSSGVCAITLDNGEYGIYRVEKLQLDPIELGDHDYFVLYLP